jgi:hypothetical protein
LLSLALIMASATPGASEGGTSTSARADRDVRGLHHDAESPHVADAVIEATLSAGLPLILIGLPGDRPDLAKLPLHLLPGVSGVLTGVDLAKQAVGEDPLRLGRVDGKPVQRRVGLDR